MKTVLCGQKLPIILNDRGTRLASAAHRTSEFSIHELICNAHVRESMYNHLPKETMANLVIYIDIYNRKLLVWMQLKYESYRR